MYNNDNGSNINSGRFTFFGCPFDFPEFSFEIVDFVLETVVIESVPLDPNFEFLFVELFQHRSVFLLTLLALYKFSVLVHVDLILQAILCIFYCWPDIEFGICS